MTEVLKEVLRSELICLIFFRFKNIVPKNNNWTRVLRVKIYTKIDLPKIPRSLLYHSANSRDIMLEINLRVKYFFSFRKIFLTDNIQNSRIVSFVL